MYRMVSSKRTKGSWQKDISQSKDKTIGLTVAFERVRSQHPELCLGYVEDPVVASVGFSCEWGCHPLPRCIKSVLPSSPHSV